MSELISRETAIELIHSLYPSAPIMRMNRKRWKKKYEPYIEAEKALEMLPSVEPGQKTGKWIDKSGGIDDAWNYCSVCGEQAIDLYDYCPNCGANMKGKQDE